MPLDAIIHADPNAFNRDEPGRHVCSLDDDGYYWFMEPRFRRLADETGQYIDLYSVATFGGDDLKRLTVAFAEIKEEISVRPPQWEVETGRFTEPEVVIFTASVSKAQFELLLEALNRAVEGAMTQNAFLSFWGD